MEKMVISFLKLSEKFSMSERQRKVNDLPLFLISRKEQTMRFAGPAVLPIFIPFP